MVKFKQTEFAAFEDEIGRLLRYDALSDPHEIAAGISDVLDIPNPYRCENCEHYYESDGERYCTGYYIETDEGGQDAPIYTDAPIPEWCEEEVREIEVPTTILDHVLDHIVDHFAAGYEEYRKDRIHNYARREREKLANGHTTSWYVTAGVDEWVRSKKRYTTDQVLKILRSFFEPRSIEYSEGLSRPRILEWAWRRHLAPTLNQEYYAQRAEAYLRALDSEYSVDTTPGTGGVEFEEDVREFMDALGFPLYARVFKFQESGSGTTSVKEADIITELSGKPTIIEVYTSGSHSDKDQQLSDYGYLYAEATGTEPLLLHLTDAPLWGYVTPYMLRLLLEHSPVPPVEAPGEYNDRRDSDRFDYSLEGFASTNSYSEYGPNSEYELPQEAQSVEEWVFEYLSRLGFEPKRPVIHRERLWSFIGPTIELDLTDGPYHIVFIGDRGDDWRVRIDDSNAALLPDMIQIGPGTEWETGLRETMGVDQLSFIEVIPGDQSMLTPRLFHLLLSLECNGS